MYFCLLIDFVLFHWSICLFIHRLHIIVDLAAPVQPGDHLTAPLLRQTLHILGLPPTPLPSVPLLTRKVVSSDPPNTIALPSWTLRVPCLLPTSTPPLSPLHLIHLCSSPAPCRAASSLISDCGLALLPQRLQISKLLCLLQLHILQWDLNPNFQVCVSLDALSHP